MTAEHNAVRRLARLLQDSDPLGPMICRHVLRKRYVVMAEAVVG